MKSFISFLFVLLTLQSCQEKEPPNLPKWYTFDTITTSNLRGVHALSKEICWASGTNGNIIKTDNGGSSWKQYVVSGYENVDFRDIHGFDANNAVILSAGFPAVVLRTSDGGNSWSEAFTGQDSALFFDALDFWDDQNGIAFSDAINDKLVLITTTDGGSTWNQIPDSLSPTVLPHQGGFAASGTCLKTIGDSSVIIGLGNAEATILLSRDRGKTWLKSSTPLDYGTPSKGNYSFDFLNEQIGICSGGDYFGDSLTSQSVARTNDGGETWKLINDTAINGRYRSCIAYVNKDTLISCSRTGTSISLDGANTWHTIQGQFYSISVGDDQSIWATGAKGRIARLKWSSN